MMPMTYQMVVLLCFAANGIAYHSSDLPPGPYCGNGPVCCDNRHDNCSFPIYDTLCYCDKFCYLDRDYDDCCPDYEEVCLHQRPTPPPQPIISPCMYEGTRYYPGETRWDNCNKCKCVTDPVTNKSRWAECTSNECLIDENLINDVNRNNLRWSARNYSEFYGKSLKDGLVYKLGTFEISQLDKMAGAIHVFRPNMTLPTNFDARRRWKNLSPIMDQGWCGADWAVSTVGVATDRFAIQSKGAETKLLSAQMLLSCKNKRHVVGTCKGAEISAAWNYAKDVGLVDEECFPYQAKDSTQVRCHFRKSDDLIRHGCKPSTPRRKARYTMGPSSRLGSNEDIMYEIMTSGPVQAVMKVQQDFFHYRNGIYRHSKYGNIWEVGYHSVRVIGWGEEYGDKFWIVANSWGPYWGEDGYFRIARGENESEIESFVITAIPHVVTVNQK